MTKEIEKLQEIINNKNNKIVFFGGAGVSTESGIPDFRSVDGLYNQKWKYPPEEILSHRFFKKHTEEFFEFYREKMMCDTAKPNIAHLKLAELEKTGRLTTIVTQNIDNLHQMAGSKNVLELHGSVHRNYCQKCGEFYDFDYIKKGDGVPLCLSCGGIIKPGVVLYGEELNFDIWNKAEKHIKEADVLIIGGTSLTVYPAATLCQDFAGRHMIIINKAATDIDHMGDLVINQPIGEVFKKIEIEDKC